MPPPGTIAVHVGFCRISGDTQHFLLSVLGLLSSAATERRWRAGQELGNRIVAGGARRRCAAGLFACRFRVRVDCPLVVGVDEAGRAAVWWLSGVDSNCLVRVTNGRPIRNSPVTSCQRYHARHAGPRRGLRSSLLGRCRERAALTQLFSGTMHGSLATPGLASHSAPPNCDQDDAIEVR